MEAAGRGGQHRDQPLLQPRHAARRQRVRPLPRTPQVALLRCRQDPEGPGENIYAPALSACYIHLMPSQVEDYAARTQRSVEETERCLSVNLAYDP